MANREQIQTQRTTYRRLPNYWVTENERVNAPAQCMAQTGSNRQREVHGSSARVDCWVRDLG